jgi:hypothetical protein
MVQDPHARQPVPMPLKTYIENGMTATDARERLELLHAERALALASGLDGNRTYLDDIDEEITGVRDAYVGLAVTEIATLRAELSGVLEG